MHQSFETPASPHSGLNGAFTFMQTKASEVSGPQGQQLVELSPAPTVPHTYDTWGAFHLVKNSENSGSGLNGKRFFGSPDWKIPRKKWNCSKGSPVFPVGTSQWKFVFHLQNFSSLYQFHAFRGLFKWPGFPGSRFQKWRLIRVRFLEAFCKQTSGLLRVLCLLRSSARAWKFIAARMCLI